MDAAQFEDFMTRLETKVETHITELRQIVQDFREEFAPACAAACITPPNELFDEEPALATDRTDEAIATLAALARQSLEDVQQGVTLALSLSGVVADGAAELAPDVQANNDRLMKACERVGDAHRLLTSGGGPGIYMPTPRKTARAYESVCHAKLLIEKALPAERKTVMNAALLVREVLCFQSSAAARGPSGPSFEQALIDAFGRPIGAQMRSQLKLSLTTVRRLGNDRQEFNRALPRTFGRQLSAEELDRLFVAYSLEATRGGGGTAGSASSSSEVEAQPARVYVGDVDGDAPWDAPFYDPAEPLHVLPYWQWPRSDLVEQAQYEAARWASLWS